jgi:fumarate reductase flavoprotein subunit
MVARLIPEIEGATFFGHPGADGSAVAWGEALGARLGDLGAYQGHGGLAYGHNIPILWPLIANGGFQVNRHGLRFSDESLGYSEQAVKVVAQPERAAWSIFDEGLDAMMRQFEDYQAALKAGAVIAAETIEALAVQAGLPPAALAATLAETQACARGARACPFGRDFTRGRALAPPFRAARVTGALFHTQGGLVVDGEARVQRASGGAFPNLFAGGGAARGVSGPGAAGYIAGNGLLTATTFGKLAGRAAAAMIR